MTDQKASLPRVSSATPHRNGSAQRNTASKTPMAAPRTQRPTSFMHATQSSAQAATARQTNSTPRGNPPQGNPPRTRPAPVRSLSSPLGRSNSVRLSKKERRWSERLADPKSPTTYADHFKDPVDMSDKLRSLNLERPPSRPSSSGSGNGGDTTYDQTFRWPRGRGSSSFRLFHPSGEESAKQGGAYSNAQSTKSSSTTANAVLKDKPSSGDREGASAPTARPASGSNGVSGLNSRSSATAAGTSRSVSVSKKNDLLQARDSAQNSVSSGDRKSSASSSESVPPAVKQSGSKDTTYTSQPANGIGPVSQRNSQSYKTANGTAGSDSITPRGRAPQQKSSSPFVYGSDSGSCI
ncbi:sericin-2-like [Littorina saxatilis]|uniref:Uncharacterized protein n=1 Tax=Littorina saxatilis TaxID=31220 RepID=A0AAN9BRN8_9CAEN